MHLRPLHFFLLFIFSVSKATHFLCDFQLQEFSFGRRQLSKNALCCVAKMNQSSSVGLENSCDNLFFPVRLRYNFSDLTHSILIAAAILSFFACPFTWFLNAMIILAVKTKRRLQTHSNMFLASLALTDLVTGLVVQPLHEVMTIFMLQRKGFHEFCQVNLAFSFSFSLIYHSVVCHLVLICGERYLTIKYSFTHHEMLTKTRVLVLSACAWIPGILVYFFLSRATMIPVTVVTIALLSSIICLQILVYKEARRHEKRILACQVSEEAKAKFKGEKKALKSTTLMIVIILLFFILPIGLMAATWFLFGEKFSESEKTTVRHFVFGLIQLISTVNPIIHVSRNKQFLVAFIELLSRKGFQEAEEIARNMCRPRRSGVRPEARQAIEMVEQNFTQSELPLQVCHGNVVSKSVTPRQPSPRAACNEILRTHP